MRLFGAIVIWLLLLGDAMAQSLRTGDSIRLASPSVLELNGDFVVNADGSVWLPRNVEVRVGSGSFEDMCRTIRAALRNARFDVVTLSISTGPRKSASITFTGAVAEPGSVSHRKGMRLSDIIAIAIPTVGADLESIQIVDVDGIVTKHKLSLSGSDAMNWNVPIRPGDQIFFPLLETSYDVTVLGEVFNPGKFAYFPGLTALKAIGMAGGLTGNAKGASIEIVRAGAVIHTVSAELNYDFELRRGDLVRVPIKANPQFIFVTGEVVKSGRFAFNPGMRLTEALNLAEGLTPLAAPHEVFLVRRVNGTLKRTRCDLEKIGNRSEPNPILEPGDAIDVGYRKPTGANLAP